MINSKKNSLLVLLLCIACFCKAQNKVDSIIENKTVLENVLFFTDRTLYISGENMWFQATARLSVKNKELSNVLYFEVLDKKGKPVVQKKFQLINGATSGAVEVPGDVITGNYYVRAYTAYMRNYEKEKIYTTEVTIINPELPAKEMLQTAVADTAERSTENDFQINAGNTFLPNSLIQLQLQSSDVNTVSVSVVKKGSYDPAATGVNRYFKPDAKKDTAQRMVYPDIRSVSISGKVVDKISGEPVKEVVIYATTIDSSRQFHVTRTDKEGKFIFSFSNLNANHQVYMVPQKSERQMTILIDADFLQGLPYIAASGQNVDSVKRALINNLYLNYQVAESYNDALYPETTYSDTLPKAFHDPTRIIYFKDYVALPTLAEYFNEIVPFTKVKAKKEGTTIQVVDQKNKQPLSQPLIMLDHIPFNDYDKFIAISPAKIISVAVLAETYIYGGEMINGMVDMITKENNLAGLELPTDVVVVDYITLDPVAKVKFTTSTTATADKPGFRNTLYWNPEIKLKGGKASVEFYAGGYLSDYDVVVTGTDKNGSPFTKIRTISISKK